MRFSVLLVNYNMSGLVTKLLGNIASQMAGAGEYEIIIADNSTEADGRLTEKMLPAGSRARLVQLEENRGFVDALNRILPLARGEYVVVMHPDVELVEGCLDRLAGFLDRNPTAGAVSPDLYYPDGSPNRIRTRFPSVGTEFRRILNKMGSILFRRRLGRDEILWDRTTDATVDAVMSVCMVFRRVALAQAGPVDPRLVFYYANDYLCGRLRKLGWSCHYVLAARAIHFERYTPKDLYKSDAACMEYKRSTVAANPRMRSDYFAFLGSFYSWPARVMLRFFAAMDDGLQFIANLRHWKSKRSDNRKLLQSLWIDLGIR